jgi:chromatin segregation and condensation protein Rec8/ScpA/Scc1 (kleisin family)
MRQINARVLSGTAQHNHSHMPLHQIRGGHGVSVFQGAQKRVGKASKPNKPSTAKPPHSMRTAARRQDKDKLSMTSAKPHHTASQNMGCVMADINLDKTNILTFFKALKRQKSLSALLSSNSWSLTLINSGAIQQMIQMSLLKACG